MTESHGPFLRFLFLVALGAALALCTVLVAASLRPASVAAAEKGEKGGEEGQAKHKKGKAGESEDVELMVNRGKTVTGKTIAEAPPFEVPARTEELEFYPCSDCHEGEDFNPKERKLEEEHTNIVLVHGGKRFWCLTCHNIENDSDTFISMKGKPIEFDKAYLLCGQCHFERQKDWYFGGHGKRVGAWHNQREIAQSYTSLKVEDRAKIGTWKGERRIFSCPACHNPHTPAIKPYKPSPPPKPRKGLEPQARPERHHLDIWERLAHPGEE